jgi:hypothetical protein
MNSSGRSPTTFAPAMALTTRIWARRGSRLADAAGERRAENLEFAKRFTEEHRETFDRLAE